MENAFSYKKALIHACLEIYGKDVSLDMNRALLPLFS